MSLWYRYEPPPSSANAYMKALVPSKASHRRASRCGARATADSRAFGPPAGERGRHSVICCTKVEPLTTCDPSSVPPRAPVPLRSEAYVARFSQAFMTERGVICGHRAQWSNSCYGAHRMFKWSTAALLVVTLEIILAAAVPTPPSMLPSVVMLFKELGIAVIGTVGRW